MVFDIMLFYGSVEFLQDWIYFNFIIGIDVVILQGSLMIIKCLVIGVLELKIGWIKDGKMLIFNDCMDMDCVGILNIYKFEFEDFGDYVCIV